MARAVVGKRVMVCDGMEATVKKAKVEEDLEFEEVMEEEDVEFVGMLAMHLERMIAKENADMERGDLPQESKLGGFFSTQKQSFSLAFYVRRLVDYAHCSNSAFIVMLVYLDRMLAAGSGLVLSDYNVHRLVTTALVLATKYLEDVVHTNLYYAKVGGIASLEEMNALEAEMLNQLHFRTFVDIATFESYQKQLNSQY